MVDVNDPGRIQQKLDRRWQQLEEADIDDRDRDAITAFIQDRRDRQDMARNTLTNDLSGTRCAAERGDFALVDADRSDLRRLFRTLARPTDQGGYGLDPDGGGMFNYKRALTEFYRFLDAEPEYGDYSWHDDIELPTMEAQGSSERDLMLTAQEVEDLKDGTRNPRDRALIALLADIGGRITLLLSLRVQDVHLESEQPYFVPNGELPDGLKHFSSRRVPILYSRAELRTYLHHDHPEPDVPSAPFWARRWKYDPETREECAVGGDRIRDMLKEAAERAGIDKPVEPRHFRRTAVTRMSNSDRLNPQEITQITGWTSNEMLDTYDYTDEDERNSGIHANLGFSDGTTGDDGESLQPVVCGNCREQISSSSHYCPNCGEPNTEDARATEAEIEDGAAEGRQSTDDPRKAVLYEKIAESTGMSVEAVEDILG